MPRVPRYRHPDWPALWLPAALCLMACNLQLSYGIRKDYLGSSGHRLWGRGPTGTAHTTLLEGERCVFGQGIRIHLEPHGMERA